MDRTDRIGALRGALQVIAVRLTPYMDDPDLLDIRAYADRVLAETEMPRTILSGGHDLPAGMIAEEKR